MIRNTQTMYIQIKKLRLYPLAIILTSLVSSLFSPVYADEGPHEQTFVVTAYYSPVPDQCCFFRGSYEEDIAFNGKGINGADGTPVYPGMVAAPDTYSFGTVIDLPGIGVATVHDRGGRIVEWGEDIHRIDVWMGTGEEGLARALAWGARKVHGTVYPVGYAGAPKEQFSLKNFDADSSVLAGLPKSDPTLLMSSLKFGDNEYAVSILQSTLKNLGYFVESTNGQFGPATQAALRKFLSDYGIPGDGSMLNQMIAASLFEAEKIKPQNLPDVQVGLEKGAAGDGVRQVQKLLRYLGYYRGRTNGHFDQALKEAVLSLQLAKGVIKTTADPGAGTVGPGTQTAIQKLWKANIIAVKARALTMKMNIAAKVKANGLPTTVLSKGDHGPDVRALQRHLLELGFLSDDDITGTFGSRTTSALLAYQKDRKIVTNDKQKGAGVYGPATKNLLLKDAVDIAWKRVREGGIAAL